MLAEPLTRETLRSDPLLAEMAILRFPNATNFPVTPSEAGRLESLAMP